MEEPHIHHYKKGTLYACSLHCNSSKLDLRTKRLLYLTTIRPQITYACTVWTTAAKTHMKTLETQNKPIRVISGAPWFYRKSNLRNELELPLLEDYCKNMARVHLKLYAQHSNPTPTLALDYDPTKIRKH